MECSIFLPKLELRVDWEVDCKDWPDIRDEAFVGRLLGFSGTDKHTTQKY